MALTPVAPTLSSPAINGFTITVNPDGNPSGTYYTFVVVTGLVTKYVNALGGLQDTLIRLPVTSITVVNAAPNLLYSVNLFAADDAVGTNSSVSSPISTITTLAAVPTVMPFTNVFSTMLEADWGANSNPDGTQFYVELTPDPSFVSGIINSGWITTLGYQFTNLVPNLPYYGRVKARNGVSVETSFAALGSVMTPVGPDTVKNTRVFNLLQLRNFLITWSPNQELNITNYRVYRSSSPTDSASFSVVQTTPANVTSAFDFVPFSFGIVFYWKVTAIDNGGNESSIAETSPVHENTYHDFEEQPFPMVATSSTFVSGETPLGTINNVNMLFTTIFPYRPGSIQVYLDGIRMDKDTEYTEGPLSQQITFLDPPDSGSMVRVDYIKFS